jgi:hypothetical protein
MLCWDDPAFFAPYFHPVIGRPSATVKCYPRLMFKFSCTG